MKLLKHYRAISTHIFTGVILSPLLSHYLLVTMLTGGLISCYFRFDKSKIYNFISTLINCVGIGILIKTYNSGCLNQLHMPINFIIFSNEAKAYTKFSKQQSLELLKNIVYGAVAGGIVGAIILAADNKKIPDILKSGSKTFVKAISDSSTKKI